jgi:hypothetical protein
MGGTFFNSIFCHYSLDNLYEITYYKQIFIEILYSKKCSNRHYIVANVQVFPSFYESKL